MKLSLVALLVFALGCTTYWAHPTKSTQQFHEDKAFCTAQAGQAVTGITDVYVAAAVRNDTFDSCMMGRGWSKSDD